MKRGYKCNDPETPEGQIGWLEAGVVDTKG